MASAALTHTRCQEKPYPHFVGQKTEGLGLGCVTRDTAWWPGGLSDGRSCSPGPLRHSYCAVGLVSGSSRPFWKDLARLRGKVGRTEEPWLGLAPGCPPTGSAGPAALRVPGCSGVPPHSVLRTHRPQQAAPVSGNYLSLSLDFPCYVDKTLRWAEAPPAPSCRPPSVRLSGLSQRRPNHDREPEASPGASVSLEPRLLRGRAFQAAACLKGRPTGLGLPVPGRGFSPSGKVQSQTLAPAVRLRWRPVCVHVGVCMCVCMHGCAHVCACMCIRACACAHVRVCECMCDACVHVCACMCVCETTSQAPRAQPGFAFGRNKQVARGRLGPIPSQKTRVSETPLPGQSSHT